MNRGHITNTGTATGTPPTGPAVVNTDTLTIQGTQTPTITLVKTASITGFNAPGTPVTYSYLVTNTGNVTLTSVAVTDPMSGLSAVTLPVDHAGPGGIRDLHGHLHHHPGRCGPRQYRQHRHGHGHAANRLSGHRPILGHRSGDPVPGISLVKSASVANFSAAGTLVTYSYLVTNTGNVTLTRWSSPTHAGLSAITCPTTSLAPAATETCTATYTTTQADVDTGTIINTGTATGTPPTGPARRPPRRR